MEGAAAARSTALTLTALGRRPRAIIFDLDNCLAPATEVSEQLLEPALAAIRAANMGTLAPDALEAAFRDCWVHSWDHVACTHGFSDRMVAAGLQAFSELEVRQPMHGYGDLDILPSLGELRFLVTTGFRRLQESKVKALRIAPHFDAVVIDAIEEGDRRGKERIFVDLMSGYRLERDDVLVVGDNPESELAAAKRLGLRSVQLLRPGVLPAHDVTGRVGGLAELRDWIEKARGMKSLD
jgi:FMN phosphatase YigB (HAD superfamily)